MSRKEFDALALVSKEDRDNVINRDYYEVVPKKVYPATIKEITRRLALEEPPARFVQAGGEIRDNPLRDLFIRAGALPPQAWDHALAARENFPPRAREARAEALEIARLWFTEVLHQQIDYAPLGVHILKDEAFRL
jgi:hypothetical protein